MSGWSPYRGDDPAYKENRMDPNVRAALDFLDGILVRGGPVAEQLWDVLTALRGPDDNVGMHRMKQTCTIPIRRAAFPRVAAANDMTDYDGPLSRASFTSHFSSYAGPLRRSADHFTNHAINGACALGLLKEEKLTTDDSDDWLRHYHSYMSR